MKTVKAGRALIYLALVLSSVVAAIGIQESPLRAIPFGYSSPPYAKPVALADMAQPRSGYRQYKNAFVRLPGETQGSLSISPALGNLPDVLSFTYSISDGQLLPAAHQVTPLNVGSDDPLTWTVSAPGAWFTTAPLAGTTPASFWVTPTVLGTNGTAFYTSAVTVTAVSPAGAEGSPHRIDLALRIVDVPLSHIYLPIALHDYTAPPPPPRYPNDPIYSSQWALEKVGAPEAWGYSTGQDVMIAVLDTGADLVHPDLAGKVRTDIDYDFTNGDDEANDDHGHGTHVSGIATAATDNGLGVASLGWEAALLPLKVMDSNGDGDSVDLAQAIYYAADREADVVNMSLGGAVSCPNHVQDAVDYAYARGVVLVAASGNHGGSDPNAEMFPANCEHVLGVAATGRGDSLASYSNYGNHVSVAAPGSEIYSTLVGGGYGHNWGTSMAVPYVAGLAALLRARYPSYTPDEIASAILDNADDLGVAGWDPYYGCGRINAHHSLLQGKVGSSPYCLQGIGPWAADSMEITVEAAPIAPFVPGEIIVSFRPGSGIEAQTTLQRYGTHAELLLAVQAWRLQVPLGQEQAILTRLRAAPSVAHADLNYLVFSQ